MAKNYGIILAVLSLFLADRSWAATANDTFTDANGTLVTSHTSDSGHTWTVQTGSSGNGEIQNNKLEDQNGNAPCHYISATPASADYDVQIDAAGTGDVGGPAGRCSTSARTNYHIQWNNGSNIWRLRKDVSGTTTVLVTDADNDPASATVTVKLSMSGSTLKLYTGGVEQTSTTDTDISAAGFGGVRHLGVTTYQLDNWSTIESAVASVPTMTLLGVGN